MDKDDHLERTPGNSTVKKIPPAERHPLFGALKGVTFVPPEVDLTEPADPDWGKVYEKSGVVPAKRSASRDP
jgi:hypothetical protein